MKQQSLEAILKEKQKEQTLTNFIRFKNEYIGEIPQGDQLVDLLKNKETSDIYKYKCSESFFIRVKNGADMLLSRKAVADPETLQKIDEFKKFIDEVSLLKFSKGQVANTEEISKVDEFLDYIISVLQQK